MTKLEELKAAANAAANAYAAAEKAGFKLLAQSDVLTVHVSDE